MMDIPTEREEEIFCAALEIESDAERMLYVRKACSGDVGLCEKLERMLASYYRGAQLFEDVSPTSFSVVELTKNLNDRSIGNGQEGFPLADDGEVGKQIGPYTLVQKIGEGGGGSVYLAEQVKPVRRQVALKIIKLGMDTKSVISRFEAERQVLAMMEHPNIAHVFDAGSTDEGRPYFVMELVQGTRITTYCDQHNLTIEQRLELSIQVCHAIQHAHQKGIIHRDIKPSNVIIAQLDGIAVPKVIDFGIAKAVSGQLMPGQTAVTAFEQFIGTPAYMSPEQADSADMDIDVRSDIYSLGVLLYELLTSKTPFDQKTLIRSGMEAMRRTIREDEPPRPSVKLAELSAEALEKTSECRQLPPTRLLALLEGDLDWIVIKALNKDRDLRYRSADGLADDIQRYLHHEAVLARPPSRRYRFRKLVRRNKRIFAAVGIATFGLLAGFGTSTWMFFRERAARMEQARLQQVAEYRSLIAQAAVRVKYGDMVDADALLAKVPIEQTPSSLEAAEAFQAAGDWHIKAGRINEAGTRFSSMARALSSADASDVEAVSLSMMPAAAAVVYAGDVQRYEEFRQMVIQRFSDTLNPAVARQILKVCLLEPADQETLHSLTRPARVVERGFESPKTKSDQSPWACLSLALLNYRAGDYAEAARWVDQGLASPEKLEVLTSTILVVRAMIEQQAGLPEQARDSLKVGEKPLLRAFADGSWMTETRPAFSWFDWLIADLLRKEALGLKTSVKSPPKLDQALVLYYHGDRDQADAILDGISDIPASPSNASIFRELGDWHATNRRWDKARARFEMLDQINELVGTDSTLDDYRPAVILVEQGYLADYERFRASRINRYAGASNPAITQRLLRECLLVPADEELMSALTHYANVTEQSFNKAGADTSVKGWQAYSLALWAYRNGDFDKSLVWCKEANPSRSGFPMRDAGVLMIRALSLQGLGRVDEARRQLEDARPLINQILSDNPPKSLGWIGYWFDQASVRIHLHEAEALIEAESTSPE